MFLPHCPRLDPLSRPFIPVCNKVLRICCHALTSHHDNATILRMLEEYFGQPQYSGGGGMTHGVRAQADAVCAGELAATQWLTDVVERQGFVDKGLLDEALGRIAIHIRTNHSSVCEWSEGHRQISRWLFDQRPECCESFTVNGVNRAAAEDVIIFATSVIVQACTCRSQQCDMTFTPWTF